MTTTTVVGVDIGQAQDPTAIAVVEVEDRKVEVTPAGVDEHGHLVDPVVRMETAYRVRRLERLPLRTSYPDVVARVVEVCAGLKGKTRGYPTLYVDATGVGRPILDLLREARCKASIYGVLFTAGESCTRREDGMIVLGKSFMVTRLRVLVESGRLHFPPGMPDREALVRELLDYQVKTDEDGHDTFGALRTGTHDDQVTAVGLCVFKERRVMTGKLVA